MAVSCLNIKVTQFSQKQAVLCVSNFLRFRFLSKSHMLKFGVYPNRLFFVCTFELLWLLEN